ncbi:sulfur carrier protein ThiS adenylyltransferase ThiF [Calditerrivibrio nitroreducens]|uniref:Thiamine biosynthesis protein ThiF n=1 Tax=Calditerrivibrio nitroreducens (strain DSM 19672 / NBRC 101217 / Yu37-1) TaxID=768670 RepID=E4TIG1_CALNY|nr:sulfur carrier protein ThiS adenylyltransferase ThiF [Calditerrivibrio nitroreducens]ADR17986.1 thiamine biosynthesis protein ThiF [Calditerrivibrio nitroreducens DSM 19672]
MLKIYLNGKETYIEKGVTLYQIRKQFKPHADLIILNSFPANEDMLVEDGDHIFLIKKHEIPSKNEMEYLLISRHTPNIYEKLKNGSVVIAGVGGLGSNIAISLARMGIGRIKFIDFDIVEPSNLNRQQYFIDQLGEKKVFALHETLKRINPYINYEPMDAYLDETNMFDLLSGCDIVLEAFDKAEEKAKLTRFMLKDMKDTFYIAASGVAGYSDTEKIKIFKIREKFFLVGDLESEAKPGMGLMAPRVAVAANIQANLAVRILLGDI